MLAIFLQTLPFFAVIALGFGAGKRGFFPPQATAALTKFVFYFALSAMLFGFSANMSLAEIVEPRAAAAYLWGCVLVWVLALTVALLRRRPLDEATMEAQCAVVGNTGFLGVPMLVLLIGAPAAPTVIMVLAIDLIVFSSLLTIMITWTREGRMGWQLPGALLLGLARNPMIVAMVAGLAWSATGLTLWAPVNAFLTLLGAAATPGALFAIGASLATAQAERLHVASWLTLCKLVLHPAAVAFAAIWLFHVPPYATGVLVAAAALPVAGNVFILAQHYGVAVVRVSASILISTAVSMVTVSLVIAAFFG